MLVLIPLEQILRTTTTSKEDSSRTSTRSHTNYYEEKNIRTEMEEIGL